MSARPSQRIPVQTAAPDVANPAPPITGRTGVRSAFPGGTPAAAPSFRVDTREVLLRRALAADAPKWAPLSADVISFYARRAVEHTPPCLPVPGLTHIQVSFPTAFVRELVN